MSAETTHSEGNDGGEADRLEEEDNVEHSDTGVVLLGNGWADEDDAHADEGEEDPSWLHKSHDTTSRKPTDGKSGLGTGKQFRAKTARSSWFGRHGIVDEGTGDCNLGTGIAELGKRGVEESVLLPERLVI